MTYWQGYWWLSPGFVWRQLVCSSQGTPACYGKTAKYTEGKSGFRYQYFYTFPKCWNTFLFLLSCFLIITPYWGLLPMQVFANNFFRKWRIWKLVCFTLDTCFCFNLFFQVLKNSLIEWVKEHLEILEGNCLFLGLVVDVFISVVFLSFLVVLLYFCCILGEGGREST